MRRRIVARRTPISRARRSAFIIFVWICRKVAMESAQDRADYPRYLLRLCELERIDRERRNVEHRIRLAHFPQTKSFDPFDFAAQPSLNKALVLELMR